MGRSLENLEQFAIDVILERRGGVRAALLRSSLYLLSLIYERLVQFRLFPYRKRIFRERALGCLVISIGNLTVGGTGKTPIVEKFARALQKGGRHVAILSRGYKSVPRPSKRSLLAKLRGDNPDPPRIVSDGKSLLLDSLTAGDEPYMLAHNLKNVVTGEIASLEKLHGTFIGSTCAIAAPDSFEDGLRKLGARIEIAKRYIDHHRYTEAELQSFISRCIRRDLEMVVTTEKDAVRFPLLIKTEVPIFFLRVEIEILS